MTARSICAIAFALNLIPFVLFSASMIVEGLPDSKDLFVVPVVIIHGCTLALLFATFPSRPAGERSLISLTRLALRAKLKSMAQPPA